jgi:23S rRNA (guanosine2251-2'-O)-methyltransferase
MALEVTSLSAISHLLKHKPEKIQALYLAASRNPRLDELERLARTNRIPTDRSYRSNVPGEQGKAVLHPFEYTELPALIESLSDEKKALVLVLDHLQDPQNFGALARSAEGLGAKAIVIPKDRGASVTGGVYNASVGAIETLPVTHVVNIGEALRKLKAAGFWIVGADHGENSKTLEETPDFDRIALVLGAEWEGLGKHILETCDWLVRIPIRGQIESLNVSAAGAILMYELLSKQTAKRG